MRATSGQDSCREAIAAGLRETGVLAGDTLLVHSSFKALGPVPGGIETVVQGLLLAIGPEGTLLMPALSWALRPPEVFDVRQTPSIVGAITEYFRTREGTTRSLHPTHSVCAVGRRTHELLDDHRLDSTCCGPHSPFRKLTETGGKIVMLGCGLGPNTTMHALDECANHPCIFSGGTHLFTLRDTEGQTLRKEYRMHAYPGYAQRYERVADIPHEAFLRQGRVLQATTYVLDAPGLRAAVLGKLQVDPFFFYQAHAQG